MKLKVEEKGREEEKEDGERRRGGEKWKRRG